MINLRRNRCGSITTRRTPDKGSHTERENRCSDMSDTQLTAIARLEERLESLKERL